MCFSISWSYSTDKRKGTVSCKLLFLFGIDKPGLFRFGYFEFGLHLVDFLDVFLVRLGYEEGTFCLIL